MPYRAWENVAYVAVTHRPPARFARRVFDRVRVSRWEQDNEQWHLLILEERRPMHPGIRGSKGDCCLSLAFVYYQLSWIMYSIRPTWSYRLNADFEDHAEHVRATRGRAPEWEATPYEVGSRGLQAVRDARRPVPPDRLRRAPPQVGAEHHLGELAQFR